jgi:hypothetical protein
MISVVGLSSIVVFSVIMYHICPKESGGWEKLNLQIVEVCYMIR